MSLKRTSACVALGVLVLLAATPSFGQGPLGLQLFAPADTSTFGGRQEPNDGYFFQYDGLWWNISAPPITTVGMEGLTRVVDYGPSTEVANWAAVESNSLDTSDFENMYSAGSRFEFGRVADRNGWMCTIFQLKRQGHDYQYDSADVVFNDVTYGVNQRLLQGPVGTDEEGNVILGDLPTVFYDITLSRSTVTWGVELMYLHRALMCHDGSVFEFFGGVRYFEFDDDFRFLSGADPGGTVPSYLSNSSWEVSAQNHIIGPQLGVRWTKQQGRFALASECRFMAGMNNQNIREKINLGPNLNPGNETVGSHPSTVTVWEPVTLGPSNNTYSDYECEWSPLIELRVEGKYQLTRYLNFRAGWTGIWTNGIARATNLIDYTLDGGTGQIMGISTANNRENVFINGLTIGFDFNR